MTEHRRAPGLERESSLIDVIEHIQRSVEALRSRLEPRPWAGPSRIAEMSYLAILTRKYPEEARKILAELGTADGDRDGHGPGCGGESTDPGAVTHSLNVQGGGGLSALNPHGMDAYRAAG